MTLETRKTFCGLCHPRCGLTLHIENGQAVGVSGDPDHPISRGKICSRARLMVEHLYHPARLNTPLKRSGERGEARWHEVSWEEALDEVAAKLSTLRDRHGAETLAFTHGTHRTYHWDGRRFFNLFGSPNMAGANNICMCPTQAVEFATWGGFTGSDMRNAKCVVIWGRAASRSDPVIGYRDFLAAKRSGAQIIVVDPRRIPEAKQADIWLQIRPGTDVALMLGWLRIIIEEELYDKDFVERWTVGFDDLRRAAQPYTPERVAEITWLDAELIVKAAGMFATTKPAVIPWGFGLDKQGVNATQSARARCALRAITGNLDVPGGSRLGWADPIGRIIGDDDLELNEALPPEQRAKQLGAERYPFFGFPGWERMAAANAKLPHEYMHKPLADMICMAHARSVFDAILTGRPYPVTAAITLANNPILALPDSRRVYDAIKALELYVVSDYYMTPSAALADFVFPAASTVERTELWLTSGFCIPCPRGVEPIGERRDDYQFWTGLASRLGQEEHWPWETVEQVWDYRLEPVGLTFDELTSKGALFGSAEPRRYEQYGFGTPSGKVELRSSIFEDLGCEPVPVYRDPYSEYEVSPELDAQYPYVLITGSRFMPMYHTEHRHLEKARQRVPDPLVTLHPDTAAELGFNEGDWIEITTPLGSIRQRVLLSPAIHRKMVDVQHGWWFPERSEAEPELFGVFECNANVLCPDDPDHCSPEIGSWPHTALRCRLDPLAPHS